MFTPASAIRRAYRAYLVKVQELAEDRMSFASGSKPIDLVPVVRTEDAREYRRLVEGAWVILRDGAPPLTADAVREFAGGRLASYKIPRYVLVVDEFPMTVTGKVRKVEMREKSVQLLELGEAAAVRTA